MTASHYGLHVYECACPNADRRNAGQWKCLVMAKCRPWLGRMPTGRNADWAQCQIFPLWETMAILILSIVT